MNDDSPDVAPSLLDGNVLAGPMSAVLVSDVTTATAVCAGCGLAGQVATLPVFGAPMGLVARCPGCDNVLISYAELPSGRTLQMHGMAALQLPPK
jgi:hypothetical protein